MKYIVIVLSAIFSITCYAEDLKFGSDLSISKGFEIRILNYDKTKRLYEIESVKFPGEDSSLVSLEALDLSIKLNKDFVTAKSRPDILLGKVFILSKDLPTFTEDEAKKRSLY